MIGERSLGLYVVFAVVGATLFVGSLAALSGDLRLLGSVFGVSSFALATSAAAAERRRHRQARSVEVSLPDRLNDEGRL